MRLSFLWLASLVLRTVCEEEHVFDEDDLYVQLEVGPEADTGEIKRAYRRLAIKHHPDKSGGDAEKFKRTTRAYEVLSDPKKRHAYDRGGLEAVERLEQQGERGGQQEGMDDLFSFFGFGGRAAERKKPRLEMPLFVTLEQLYAGVEVKARGFRQGACLKCRGTGAHTKKDIKACSQCGGQGVTVKMHQIAPGMYQQMQTQCRACGGQGRVIAKKCSSCKGSKIGDSVFSYSVFLEKGTPEGHKLTFEHALDETGDEMGADVVWVVKTVASEAGRHFRREADHLHATVQLTLKEALLGFEKTLVHLDGHVVRLSRPDRVTEPDLVQKLSGEGFPIRGSPGEFGDLFVKYEVVFPSQLTDAQVDALRQLAEHKSNRFVLGVDQGTTSTRAVLFDLAGKPVRTAQRELAQIATQPGWCEHDPREILASVEAVMAEVLANSQVRQPWLSVAAIGIANQRETLVAWDRETGEPLHNAVVWLDTRTAALAAEFRETLADRKFREISGLPVSTYFSALKMRWLLDHVVSVQQALVQKRLCFGTVDSWLVFKLSADKRLHVTDITNASRYNLMDLRTGNWSEELCYQYGIPLETLPRIVSSSEILAHYNSVPIAALLGDQQAALLGQGCVNKGQAKITYGTGAFLLVNAGEELRVASPALLTTVAFKLGPGAPVFYALEAALASAGRAVDWLVKELGVAASNEELERLAASVQTSEGVSLVPAFAGLFCPQWRPDARGCLLGLSLATKKAHICRAALEGVALQVQAVIAEISDLHLHAPLTADGGMTANRLFLQIQADVINQPVAVREFREATVWGAALAAGLAVGVFRLSEIPRYLSSQGLTHETQPRMGEAERQKLVAKFSDAVSRSLNLSHFE